jgi:hypothetical protein
MNSLVSYGYQKGLVDADDLSIDSSSTVSAKKWGRRLPTTTATTRRRKEAKYMQ